MWLSSGRRCCCRCRQREKNLPRLDCCVAAVCRRGKTGRAEKFRACGFEAAASGAKPENPAGVGSVLRPAASPSSDQPPPSHHPDLSSMQPLLTCFRCRFALGCCQGPTTAATGTVVSRTPYPLYSIPAPSSLATTRRTVYGFPPDDASLQVLCCSRLPPSCLKSPRVSL